VAGSLYELVKQKRPDLIRKALQGSAFLASTDADVPDRLSDATDGLLAPFPVGTPTPYRIPWQDGGLTSTDGVQFSNDVTSSDVTSWGESSASRSDIVSDQTSATVLFQETKLLTIGLYTGAELLASSTETDGALIIDKPARPKSRSYRLLSLAVDDGDDGEIYIARLLPRAKVVGKAEQAFGAGDDPIGWGVTFQGQVDPVLGSSERWYFEGPGWKALATSMGFEAPV
jgi:hypothetical protein